MESSINQNLKSVNIRTPDQRLRIFVSSTMQELAEERQVVKGAIEQLHLIPVLFELGVRPHPPRDLYRSYLSQSLVRRAQSAYRAAIFGYTKLVFRPLGIFIVLLHKLFYCF